MTTIRPADASLSGRVLEFASGIRARRIEVLAGMNLLAGQDDFLLALLATDGITMGSLAENLGISASSATKAAIKLEAAGLIRRESSRVDSRQNYAYLTPAGRDQAREIVIQYEKLEAEAFANLNEKGVQRLVKLLDRLEKTNSGAGKKPRKAGASKAKKAKTKKTKAPTKAKKGKSNSRT